MIVAIGGDGAVLRAAQVAIAHDKPLLGINTGRLGHLCCLQLKELETIDEVQFAAFQISPRTLLEFEADGKIYYALNDVIIAKEHFGETLELKCSVDGEQMKSFRGDGLIIATPTGSTAYSMSAGGPIVDPCLDAILMTPICPHQLTTRPLIFSGSKFLSVKSNKAEEQQLYLSLDGSIPIPLEENEYVTIHKAPRAARFINFGEREFFEVFSEKIVQKR
jgi:NAD+ kinase